MGRTKGGDSERGHYAICCMQLVSAPSLGALLARYMGASGAGPGRRPLLHRRWGPAPRRCSTRGMTSRGRRWRLCRVRAMLLQRPGARLSAGQLPSSIARLPGILDEGVRQSGADAVGRSAVLQLLYSAHQRCQYSNKSGAAITLQSSDPSDPGCCWKCRSDLHRSQVPDRPHSGHSSAS